MKLATTAPQPGLDRWLSGSWLAFVALALAALAGFLWQQAPHLDGYEWGILLGGTGAVLGLALFWPPLRWFLPLPLALAWWAMQLYQGQLPRAETQFFLKYFLASQSAILWMSLCCTLALLHYWVGMFRPGFSQRLGRAFTWLMVGAALLALLMRWHESYLIAPDVGHIPVSNLYEVFVLFTLTGGLMHLYYETRMRWPGMGAFSLLVLQAGVAFLLWYSLAREAHAIRPLVPALQSWWMKIHVPANFIGYGAFALAAMVGLARLLPGARWRLPEAALLDELMYRVIAVGFLFFTLATILGALWAAKAWGSYWSWDAKETWAFIVWLNYAAWLHARQIHGLRGATMAVWALLGFLLTLFAFLGVNLWLSGLHSYGQL